jgi:flavin-dependent dehydrogenase
MNVLLIDKAIFPRDKLCGGAVSESALAYLDFDVPQGIIEREIYGARVHFKDTCLEIRTPSVCQPDQPGGFRLFASGKSVSGREYHH